MQGAFVYHHPGLQVDHRAEPAAGQDLQVFGLDDAHGVGGVLVDDGALRLDHHLLDLDRLAAETELQVCGEVGRDAHFLHGDGAVPDVGRPQGIDAGGDVEQEEAALGVGRGGGFGFHQEDIGIGQGLPGIGVKHLAGDLPPGGVCRADPRQGGEAGNDQQAKQAAVQHWQPPLSTDPNGREDNDSESVCGKKGGRHQGPQFKRACCGRRAGEALRISPAASRRHPARP